MGAFPRDKSFSGLPLINPHQTVYRLLMGGGADLRLLTKGLRRMRALGISQFQEG